jgi:hypothetical protein
VSDQSPNNSINTDGKKRHSFVALLFPTGYDARYSKRQTAIRSQSNSMGKVLSGQRRLYKAYFHTYAFKIVILSAAKNLAF